MSIPLRIGLEGIVTVDCMVGGKVVHTQRMKNIITDQGLTALKHDIELGARMIVTCVLGNNGAPASAANKATDLWVPWTPVCGSDSPIVYRGEQVRSVVAVSEDNGTISDVFQFQPGDGTPYWLLRRMRFFEKNTDHFQAPLLAAMPNAENRWWRSFLDLDWEAADIREVGFLLGTGFGFVERSWPSCREGVFGTFAGIWSGGVSPETQYGPGTALWNRVALGTPISFETPWGALVPLTRLWEPELLLDETWARPQPYVTGGYDPYTVTVLNDPRVVSYGPQPSTVHRDLGPWEEMYGSRCDIDANPSVYMRKLRSAPWGEIPWVSADPCDYQGTLPLHPDGFYGTLIRYTGTVPAEGFVLDGDVMSDESWRTLVLFRFDLEAGTGYGIDATGTIWWIEAWDWQHASIVNPGYLWDVQPNNPGHFRLAVSGDHMAVYMQGIFLNGAQLGDRILWEGTDARGSALPNVLAIWRHYGHFAGWWEGECTVWSGGATELVGPLRMWELPPTWPPRIRAVVPSGYSIAAVSSGYEEADRTAYPFVDGVGDSCLNCWRNDAFHRIQVWDADGEPVCSDLYQTIKPFTVFGFDEDVEVAIAQWESERMLLPDEGVVRVTYELRVYPETAPVVQSMTIEGVATTVTTKLIDFDNPVLWGADGFLTSFGLWATDQYAAKLVETGSYGATIYDVFTYGTAENVDSAIKQNPGGFAQTQRYKAGPAVANFPAGIGFMAHGQFGGGHVYVTQFDPPISKTAVARIQLDVSYTWSRR